MPLYKNFYIHKMAIYNKPIDNFVFYHLLSYWLGKTEKCLHVYDILKMSHVNFNLFYYNLFHNHRSR